MMHKDQLKGSLKDVAGKALKGTRPK